MLFDGFDGFDGSIDIIKYLGHTVDPSMQRNAQKMRQDVLTHTLPKHVLF